MSRMFSFITGTCNPLGGVCPGLCSYCWAQSEKGLAKRYGHIKYQGPPRLYAEVLRRRYREGDFIFDCDMRDKYSPDVPDEMIHRVYEWQAASPEAVWLDLTKYPTRYPGLLRYVPGNVVLGATIETDLCISPGISRAPQPSLRLEAMERVARNTRNELFVSVEPIMSFRLEEFAGSLKRIDPWMVAVGYDNYGNTLPEPPLEETERLIELLEEFTYVERKTIRKAWWED